MCHSHKSGNNGWVIALAIVGGIVLARRILPALSRILSMLLGLGAVGVIALVVLVIYFTTRGNDKKRISNQQEETTGNSNGRETNYRTPEDTQKQTTVGTNYQANSAEQTADRRAPQTPPEERKNSPMEKDAGQQAVPPCELSAEAKRILNKGRDHVNELRRLLGRIQNLNVKKRGEDICAESEKILFALRQQPEDIPMVRRFFNYYLPTLGNILLKYLRLEESGMATEQTTVKVMSCLGEIKVAMEKQYAAIFENDLLDLTVEMEALTRACKRDGLLVSEEFTIREGNREINLTI